MFPQAPFITLFPIVKHIGRKSFKVGQKEAQLLNSWQKFKALDRNTSSINSLGWCNKHFQ